MSYLCLNKQENMVYLYIEIVIPGRIHPMFLMFQVSARPFQPALQIRVVPLPVGVVVVVATSGIISVLTQRRAGRL